MIGRAFLTLLIPLMIGRVAWSQDSAGADSVAAEIVLPAPVTNLIASDKDNDHGHAVVLQWDLSADDGQGQNSVTLYLVERWVPNILSRLLETTQRIDAKYNMLVGTDEGDDQRFEVDTTILIDTIIGQINDTIITADTSMTVVQWTDDSLIIHLDSLRFAAEHIEELVSAGHLSLHPDSGSWWGAGAPAPSGQNNFTVAGIRSRNDSAYVPDNVELYFRVTSLTSDSAIVSTPVMTSTVQASSQWYNSGRKFALISVIVFTLLMYIFVFVAKRGANLYIRPLAGIEAVDEAIGRATEMGRPILYILGLGDASQIATIASFTILGRVAKKVAEYQTTLIVPCYDPIVMSIAQEVVKSAFLDAGYPDAYDEESVYFVTQSQFAYVAAVNGTMLREKPATNLYLGTFFAESLLLAETGALAGSIQIAGTDQLPQLPFFIVACDYTLIGEELFAASAYLGREPVLLGSLKAQDYAKAAVIVLAIVGMVLVNLGFINDSWSGLAEFKNWFVITD